jgi:hypothetical protein
MMSERSRNALNLYAQAHEQLKGYDRMTTDLVEKAPWLSQAAAMFGANLFLCDRRIIGNFLRGRS